jgi:myo-inositol-1(or 4)-monophosphatase
MSPAAEKLAAVAVDVAGEAAQSVAEDLRRAFRAPMSVEHKRDDHDPVTEHDRRAEQVIRAVIRRRMPHSVVIGEEAGTEGTGDVEWYVDPIDGTANFANGLAFFCVSVGAVVDGDPIAGAVLDPMTGDLFTASPDGAWLNGRPLRSRGAAEERRALLLTSYPSARLLQSHGPAALERLGRMIDGYATVRRVGSAALTLAHVAAGWADAAFGVGVNPWDVAAAQLLLRQAGGTYVPLWEPDTPPARDIDAPGYLAHVEDLDPRLLTTLIDEMPLAAVVPGPAS